MRQFASSGFKIWNLGREAKVLYTIFGIFALAAYAVSVIYAEDLAGGLGGAAVRTYYAGEDARAAPAPPAPARGGGPAIELPPEAEHPMRPAISYRHLLEVTHFHLFTVPVFLLIVGHLFMLTGLGSRTKLAWILLAGISSLVHVAAPWWLRYGRGSALALSVSGAAMLGSLGLMTGYVMVAMWRAPGPAPRSDSSPP